MYRIAISKYGSILDIIMNTEKLLQEFTKLINQKDDLSRDLAHLLKTKDKQKTKEVLIENAADDIVMFGKMKYWSGVDPSEALPENYKEALKRLLWELIK